MGGWLAAVGGVLKDRVEDRLMNKQRQPYIETPAPSMDIAHDPAESTIGYAKYKAQQSPLGRAIAGGMNRYRQHRADQAVQSNAAEQPMPYDPSTMPQLQAQGESELAGIQPDLMAQGRIVTEPTVALLGEKGDEMVIPMNGDPNNKTSMPMRQRYRQ